MASSGAAALRAPPRARRRIAAAGLASVVVAALGGCATLGYYAQSVDGHLDLMARRRPIPEVIADPGTDEELRARLTTALEIREFATRELALPDGPSYRSYADLGREYVVWSVTATPELSMEPKTWCLRSPFQTPWRIIRRFGPHGQMMSTQKSP